MPVTTILQHQRWRSAQDDQESIIIDVEVDPSTGEPVQDVTDFWKLVAASQNPQHPELSPRSRASDRPRPVVRWATGPTSRELKRQSGTQSVPSRASKRQNGAPRSNTRSNNAPPPPPPPPPAQPVPPGIPRVRQILNNDSPSAANRAFIIPQETQQHPESSDNRPLPSTNDSAAQTPRSTYIIAQAAVDALGRHNAGTAPPENSQHARQMPPTEYNTASQTAPPYTYNTTYLPPIDYNSRQTSPLSNCSSPASPASCHSRFSPPMDCDATQPYSEANNAARAGLRFRDHGVASEAQPPRTAHHPIPRLGPRHPQASYTESAYPRLAHQQSIHPQPVHPQSVYPQPVHPRLAHPEPVYPQLDHPQSVRPEPVHPQLDHPQSVYPQSVYPQSVYPQSVRPQPVHPQLDHPQSARPQPVHQQLAHPHSVHSQLAHPQSAHPQSVHPQLAHPQPVYPQSVHPRLAHPQPVHPQLDHPQSVRPQPVHQQPVHQQLAHPQSVYPQSVYPQSAHPQSVYPQSVHPQPVHTQPVHPQPGYQRPVYQQPVAASRPAVPLYPPSASQSVAAPQPTANPPPAVASYPELTRWPEVFPQSATASHSVGMPHQVAASQGITAPQPMPPQPVHATPYPTAMSRPGMASHPTGTAQPAGIYDNSSYNRASPLQHQVHRAAYAPPVHGRVQMWPEKNNKVLEYMERSPLYFGPQQASNEHPNARAMHHSVSSQEAQNVEPSLPYGYARVPQGATVSRHVQVTRPSQENTQQSGAQAQHRGMEQTAAQVNTVPAPQQTHSVTVPHQSGAQAQHRGMEQTAAQVDTVLAPQQTHSETAPHQNGESSASASGSDAQLRTYPRLLPKDPNVQDQNADEQGKVFRFVYGSRGMSRKAWEVKRHEDAVRRRRARAQAAGASTPRNRRAASSASASSSRPQSSRSARAERRRNNASSSGSQSSSSNRTTPAPAAAPTPVSPPALPPVHSLAQAPVSASVLTQNLAPAPVLAWGAAPTSTQTAPESVERPEENPNWKGKEAVYYSRSGKEMTREGLENWQEERRAAIRLARFPIRFGDLLEEWTVEQRPYHEVVMMATKKKDASIHLSSYQLDAVAPYTKPLHIADLKDMIPEEDLLPPGSWLSDDGDMFLDDDFSDDEI